MKDEQRIPLKLCPDTGNIVASNTGDCLGIEMIDGTLYAVMMENQEYDEFGYDSFDGHIEDEDDIVELTEIYRDYSRD